MRRTRDRCAEIEWEGGTCAGWEKTQGVDMHVRGRDIDIDAGGEESSRGIGEGAIFSNKQFNESNLFLTCANMHEF